MEALFSNNALVLSLFNWQALIRIAFWRITKCVLWGILKILKLNLESEILI